MTRDCYLAENPFITFECNRLGIDKAPITTNVQESYAQCNEDLIVEGLLRSLTDRSGRTMDTVRYLEIGANHPIQTSSTYLLYRVHGARGFLVEANPRLVQRLKDVRPRDVVLNCAVTASREPTVTFYVHEKHELSSTVVDNIAKFTGFGGVAGIVEAITCPNMHINDLISSLGRAAIDFMSIDIEGADNEVLAAMDGSFRPSIIQCEHNANVSVFSTMLAAKGYRLIALTDVNAIYLHGTAGLI